MAARLLAVTSAAEGTSYARVLRATLGELRSFDVHRATAGPDPAALVDLVRRIRPHRVLLLNDVLKIPAYLPALQAADPALAVAAWCPVEGEILRPDAFAFVRELDAFATCTPRSAEAVRRALGLRGAAARRVGAVPHGVDRTAFHDMEDRAAARAQLWRHRPELRDAFLVLNANRNQDRKRLDVTLDAFAELARERPRAYLVLPCFQRGAGLDVRAAARARGFERQLLHGPDPARVGTLDDAALNLLYNACDVGLNTSAGEGFGMIAFEHAATGAAQVMPRHSACEELWDGVAELVDAPDPDPGAGLFALRAPRAGAVATCLARLHDDAARRDALARRCRARALRADTTWSSVARAWEELIARR